jgi:hypothetical protein
MSADDGIDSVLECCCQERVGTCGYVLSCLVLNVLATQGPPTLGPLARYLEYPRTWLLGARAHAQPGCEDKLDWADR